MLQAQPTNEDAFKKRQQHPPTKGTDERLVEDNVRAWNGGSILVPGRILRLVVRRDANTCYQPQLERLCDDASVLSLCGH